MDKHADISKNGGIYLGEGLYPMLKRIKVISIFMVLTLCMTFMVPGFIFPDKVQAGSTYEVIKAPTVKNSDQDADLGVIKVTVADQVMIAGSKVNVSLPSDIMVNKGTEDDPIPDSVYVRSVAASVYKGIFIVAPSNGDGVAAADFDGPFKINNDNSFDIQMKNTSVTSAGADKYFYIYFNNINLCNTTGDINVRFFASSGSGFSSSGSIVIAKSSESGATTTIVKKVKDVTDLIGDLDNITVVEDRYGTLNLDKAITLEILTPGFTWKNAGTAEFGWSLSGNKALTIDINRQKARLDLNGVAGPIINNRTTSEAKITISGLEIEVDPNQANPGDTVEVKLSGADMTPATLVVARYSADKNLRGTVGLQNTQDSSGVRLSLYQGSSLIVQSTSCADGSFSFSNIPPGTYCIRAEKSNWLSTKIEGINVNPGKTTIVEPIFLSFGDLNNDGIVDLFDLVILSQNYGKSAL